ncbi:hypothetical protein [Actinomycetospora flava]|uniref:Uncharacterized protein n=1 Tax=Actinomycetospora flava TaxID=3129232 RepID=A0ABU8MGD1_9PSEU
MAAPTAPAAPSKAAEKADEKPASTAVEAAKDQATRLTEAIGKIRTRADTTAKGLLAFGGAALAALGITKATDLTPEYWSVETVTGVAAAVAGFILVAVALAWFSARLWRVGAPVFTSSDLIETQEGLGTDEEEELVANAYTDMARLNGVRSLLAYEARGWRLQRIASRADEDRKKELLQEADMIRAEVRAVHARAGALVVRERASRAITGGSTIVAGALFLAGLIALTAGAGLLSTARNDALVATAKACAEAQAAIDDTERDVELPPGCGPAPDDPVVPPATVAEATAQENRRVAEVISGLYQACIADRSQLRAVCDARLDDLNQTRPR